MPDRTEIFDAIHSHLVGRGIEAEDVTMKADLMSDLYLDSLDTMELTVGMEERFGIEIPDGDLESLRTVADAVDLIERRLSVTA